MAQGTLPGFISALRAGPRPIALRNVLRASRAHPSFPFSYISGVIDSLLDFSIFLFLVYISKERFAIPGTVWYAKYVRVLPFVWYEAPSRGQTDSMGAGSAFTKE